MHRNKIHTDFRGRLKVEFSLFVITQISTNSKCVYKLWHRHTMQSEYTTDHTTMCNTTDESHECNVKWRMSDTSVHTTWFSLCKVQKLEKLSDTRGHQERGDLRGGAGLLGVWKGFWEVTFCFLTWTCGYVHILKMWVIHFSFAYFI